MTSHTAIVAAWWVVVALFAAIEVAARVGHRLLRTSEVAARLESNRYRRAALLLGWMWLGWHFFAR